MRITLAAIESAIAQDPSSAAQRQVGIPLLAWCRLALGQNSQASYADVLEGLSRAGKSHLATYLATRLEGDKPVRVKGPYQVVRDQIIPHGLQVEGDLVLDADAELVLAGPLRVTGKISGAGSILCRSLQAKTVAATGTINAAGVVRAEDIELHGNLTCRGLNFLDRANISGWVDADGPIKSAGMGMLSVDANLRCGRAHCHAIDVGGAIHAKDAIEAESVQAYNEIRCSGDLRASNIHTLSGGIHCLGEIHVSENLVAGYQLRDRAEISATVIHAHNLEAGGVEAVQCLIEGKLAYGGAVHVNGDLICEDLVPTTDKASLHVAGTLISEHDAVANAIQASRIYAGGSVKAQTVHADSIESGVSIQIAAGKVGSASAPDLTLGEGVAAQQADRHSAQLDLFAEHAESLGLTVA
jgi:cytoskeletal protein CcmA (bactofilin family)